MIKGFCPVDKIPYILLSGKEIAGSGRVGYRIKSFFVTTFSSVKARMITG